jgi:hypothetical protein
MGEPYSGERQQPDHRPATNVARRSSGPPFRARFPGRGGSSRLTRRRALASIQRWARVCAVAGLLAVSGIVTGAGAGTALADGPPDTLGLWSGYVAYPGPFDSASADFVVPGASCTQGPGETGPWTGFWVGLSAPGAIDQTGFEVYCDAGQPTYTAWHSDLSGTPTMVSDPMQPGDQVDVNVFCWPNWCYQQVQDVTQNWISGSWLSVPDSFTPDIAAVAAESGEGGVTTGPVQVTYATVDGSPLGQFSPLPNQQNPALYNGMAGLDPTGLDPTGTAFQFYWDGSTGS